MKIVIYRNAAVSPARFRRGAGALDSGAPCLCGHEFFYLPSTSRGQKHISTASLGVTVGDQRHGIWLLGTEVRLALDGDNPFHGRDQREDLARRDGLPVDVPPETIMLSLFSTQNPQGGVDVAGGHQIAQGGIPFAVQAFEAALLAIEEAA